VPTLYYIQDSILKELNFFKFNLCRFY